MANTSVGGKTAGLMTRRELSAPGVLSAAGVHMMTITKWEQDGMPVAHRGGPGRPSFYDPEAVRAWKEKRDADANAAVDGPLVAIQERARKELWQGRLAEQTFLMRQRELLPRAEVEKVWAAEVTAVRSRLLALPTTLSDRLHRAAVVDGVDGVEKMLDDAVRDILRELADPVRDITDEAGPKRKRRPRKAKKKSRARKKPPVEARA